MSNVKRIPYLARFHPQATDNLKREAVHRDVSVQKVLDDAVILYFRLRGTDEWVRSLSLGPNSE